VGYRARIEPQYLFADGKSRATISVVGTNKIGWDIPCSAIQFRCVFDEGQSLASIQYFADSTSVVLTAHTTPGKVTLVLFSDALVFPIACEISIRSLIADRTETGTTICEVRGFSIFMIARM